MGQTLEALHRLQVVELELADIRRTRAIKARRVATQRRQVDQADERLHEKKLSVTASQMQADALQLDVSSRDESLNRHRQALNQAKTNKEYAAILTAMNTEKADTTKLENVILQHLEEIQNFTEETQRIEEEKVKLLENVARTEQSLVDYDEKTQSRVAELQKQRDEFAAAIDAVTLATFTRVAEHHDGDAMALAEKINPRRDEYICAGCNMTLTLEIISQLRSLDEIQFCKVCGRILYLEVQASQPSHT